MIGEAVKHRRYPTADKPGRRFRFELLELRKRKTFCVPALRIRGMAASPVILRKVTSGSGALASGSVKSIPTQYIAVCRCRMCQPNADRHYEWCIVLPVSY